VNQDWQVLWTDPISLTLELKLQKRDRLIALLAIDTGGGEIGHIFLSTPINPTIQIYYRKIYWMSIHTSIAQADKMPWW
jgi:hypothetical protein